MRRQLSKLVTKYGGRSPGAGYERVSPGMYRKSSPQSPPPGAQQLQPMPQGFNPNNVPPMQRPTFPYPAQGGNQNQLPPFMGGGPDFLQQNSGMASQAMPKANIQAPQPPWASGQTQNQGFAAPQPGFENQKYT